MMRLAACFGMVALICAMGCSNPADNLPKASTSAATNTPTAAPAGGAEKVFALDTTDSSIGFTGSKITGKHDGGFKNFAGEFRVQGGQITATGNKIVIDTRSIWTDTDRLTGHLKSADFFDVAKNPTATFETTSVAQQGTNATVTGNLTLHGITKQISFPAKVQVTDDVVTVDSDFALNRLDFEMKYPGKPDDLIRKEVVLRLNIKAKPGKADFAKVQ